MPMLEPELTPVQDSEENPQLTNRSRLIAFSRKYIFNRFIISELMLLVTVIGMIFGWSSSGNINSLPSIFFFLAMMLTFLFQLFLLQVLFRVTSSPEKLLEQISISNFKIEHEKAKLDTIVTSIGDAVFAVDLNGHIILMNSVAQNLSGYSVQEADGKYYGEIFHFLSEDSTDMPYPNYVEQVMESGQAVELSEHTVLVRRDGQKLAISDSCAPIK